MEPMMISFRVWSTAAAIALVLPIAAMTASLAAPHGGGARGGVGGAHFGGAGAAHFGGGGAPAHFGGGGGWHGAGGYRRGFIPGAVAGAVVGGAIATAPYGYYGGPGYYDGPGYDAGYYDDQYYDQGPVVAAPAPGGDDAVAYCMQTYRSYDPRSGTYMGFDGLRHPCP
jgi:BA14K-like protein